MRTTTTNNLQELTTEELANVSGGESITFVYGKLAVQYTPQKAD